MKKIIIFPVSILLIYTATLQSLFVSGISLSRIKQDLKVSNILDSIGNLSKVELPSEVVEFSSQIAELGAKYTANELKFSIRYLLFTPMEPSKGYNLEISEESLSGSTFNASSDTKFLIHGLGTELKNTSVFLDIKDELFKIGDFNVIVVNWTDYNGLPYTTASLNSVFVGFEVGRLVQLLIDSKNITPRSVHLIGHSLGGQSASFSAKVVENIGRISGLDAAGPIFQNLPANLRISEDDADFVDAIHTDGAQTFLGGFGTYAAYGDVDFFPNGGSSQPNCSLGDTFLDTDNNSNTITNPIDIASCSHDRVLFLFLNSINTCRFEAVNCSSYEDFEDGKCPKEMSAVSRMGYYATPVAKPPSHSMFYLNTAGSDPYCQTS